LYFKESIEDYRKWNIRLADIISMKSFVDYSQVNDTSHNEEG